MKKLLLLFFCILLCAQNFLIAQDTHFSQYFNKPLLLNPSLAGNGIEHIRLTAIYRNQWAGFGDPFTSQGFSVDKVVNRIGIGAMVTRNGGGSGAIATLNLVGNLAYHLPLGYDNEHTVSAGVQVGIVNKSFDPSKLTFDNQYNPDQGYDPTQGNGEVFTNTSITRPDLNAGFFYQRGWLKKDIKFKPFAGISFSHLNRPVETFIIDETRVKIKNTLYGGAGFVISDRSEIKPSVLYNTQGTFKETVIGTNYNFQLDSKNQVQLGVHHRVNDAVIAYAGYQMNQLFVGTSYDFNTGELSKTGKGTNAFEISIAYSPRPKKKKEVKETKVIPVNKKIVNKKIPLVKSGTIPNETVQEIITRPVTETIQIVFIPVESVISVVEATKTTEIKTATTTPVKTETQTKVIPKENISTISSAKTPTISSPTNTIVPVTKQPNTTTITIPEERFEPLTTTPVTSVKTTEILTSTNIVVPATKQLNTTTITIPEERFETITTPVASVKATEIQNSKTNIAPVTKEPVNITITIPEEKIETVVTTPVAPKTDLSNVIDMPGTDIPSSIQNAKATTENIAITVPNEVVEPVLQISATPVIITHESTLATKPEVKAPIDSDKDGISDEEDLCPYIKGGKLTNGCPDSDSDGLIDMKDDCPLESGPVTNNGCPDPNIPQPVNNQELVKTFDHILFTKGSIKMTTDDIYDIVERAVDMLYADKKLTVLLSGHTDSEGDESFNMNLSQSRTEIVKAYLVKQGIPESRIQTVAYGETMPLSNNLFEETMKQNRRVELNILRKK